MEKYFISEKRYQYFFLLLLIVLPAVFLGNGKHELLLPDEPREAEIGREMWVSGDFIVPTINGKIFLEKPPLFYWTVAAVFGIAGKSSAFLSRLSPALFGLGILLFTYAVAAKMFGRKIGFASALITFTSKELINKIHKCMIDPSLAFFVIGAIYFFVSGCLYGKKKLLNFSLMYVMMSLAFLSKGFIGVVIPLSVIFAFLIFEKKISGIKELRIWLGILIFLVITAPWFILLWREGGAKYYHIFFIDNHWDRFFYAALGHKQGFFFYFLEIFDVLFPWSILLPFMLYDILIKRKSYGFEKRKEILLTRIFAFLPLILLSFSSTKRSLYLLPVVPAYAILAACWLEKEFLKMSPTSVLKFAGKIFTATVLVWMSFVIAIFTSNQGINLVSVIGIIAAVLLFTATVIYSLENKFHKLFISVVICIIIMYSPYYDYRTDEGSKSFYNVANSIKKETVAGNDLRAIKLNEHEIGINFYLNKLIPEDKTWDNVKNNLLSDKNIEYIVADEKLEKSGRDLPKGIKVKYVGFAGGHNYFLISKRNLK